MKTRENTTTFESMNEKATEFYNRHGWVVINQRLDKLTVDEARSSWVELRERCAQEMGVSMDAYRKEISQWRDLWTHGGAFLNLLDNHEQVRGVAQDGMDWSGVRLLHDHIIAKPAGKTNKKIPWHQDSMFWPVDLPGCSTWTPMEDVGVTGGCLEVIDASHLEGCEQPVDFMAEERWEFGDEAERVLLPVKAGSTVLLHSLTWHRSSPNTTDSDRPVHIGLWIHPSARWRPDLVDWHPVNAHCSIEPGQRLEGDMFPMWGEVEETQVPDVQIHDGTVRSGGISMFDASSILSRQISTILQKKVAFLHFFHRLNNGMRSWRKPWSMVYVTGIKKKRFSLFWNDCTFVMLRMCCIKLVTSSTPRTQTGGILQVKHGLKLWRND